MYYRKTASLLAMAVATFSTLAYAEPPPLEAYGSLPAIEDAAMSPDGSNVAVAGTVNGRRQITVTGANGQPLAIVPINTLKLHYLTFGGNDTVLAQTSVTADMRPEFLQAKGEFSGSMLIPLAPGRKVEMVFGRSANLVNATFGSYGVRQVGGKWMAHFGGVEMERTVDRKEFAIIHGRPALFAVDMSNNSVRKVDRAAPENAWKSWLLDADGTPAAVEYYNYDKRTWEINNAQGQRIADGRDALGNIGMTGFGPDGTTVIYRVIDNKDPSAPIDRYFEVPLTGGAPKEVFADAAIDHFYIDGSSGRVLGYRELGGTRSPILFDPAKQAVFRKVIKAFGKQHASIVEWTPSLSHFIVATSGSGNPGTWYLVDVAHNRADPIGFERPLIPADQVGPISTFHYKASDGIDISAILTLPPGKEAKNLPVIVLPHGGPHSEDVEDFDWWAQAFASRGYAVLQPNFRGSTNRDRAFEALGYGQWGRKMQTDLSDGLAALAAQGTVDARRACIMGASYGGFAALAGVTIQKGIYRCAVSVGGVSDLRDLDQTRYRNSGQSKFTQDNVRQTLGDPAGWDAVSPRRNAARASAPILLIHGNDDSVVEYRHSTAMADALRAAGKPYEFVKLDEEDHWLTRAATRKQMLSAAMAFMLRNNPPD